MARLSSADGLLHPRSGVEGGWRGVGRPPTLRQSRLGPVDVLTIERNLPKPDGFRLLEEPHLPFFEYTSRTLLFPDSLDDYAYLPFDRTQVTESLFQIACSG